MKIISSKAHGILDYLTVVFLGISPSLFHMTGHLASFTYGLCAVHFLLTILTRFELGFIKLIPFRIHGVIEFFVSILLAVVAWRFYDHGNFLGAYYYTGISLAIIIVFLLTDFNMQPHLVNKVS